MTGIFHERRRHRRDGPFPQRNIGLGANIETDGFRSQYNQAFPAGGFTMVKSSAAGRGQFPPLPARRSPTMRSPPVNEAVSLYQAIRGCIGWENHC